MAIEHSTRHAWLRLMPVWYVLGAGTLLATTIRWLFYLPEARTRVFICSIALLWFSSLISAPIREGVESRGLISALWLACGMAITTWAITIHPLHSIWLCFIYPLIFAHLSFKWAAVFSTLMTFAWIHASFSTSSPSYYQILLIGLISNLAAITLGGFIHAIISQSKQRNELIEQLLDAQTKQAVANREAGRLAERQRIARELHATLAQDLASAALLLEADKEKKSPHHSETIGQLLKTGHEKIRRIIWSLRPDLSALALETSIERLVRDLNWKYPKLIDFQIHGEPIATTDDQRRLIELTAREGIANALKHGHPNKIIITLSYLKDHIHIDIGDNGKGITVSDTKQDGFGITDLRHETSQLGGRLCLNNRENGGATLTLELPLEKT